MKADEWKVEIKKQMESIGTYKDAFESSIDTLAEILEKRDDAKQSYIESGGDPVYIHVLDRGGSNPKVNPAIRVWMDLNNQALGFWKEMGLTPAGLKRINESAIKEKQTSALEKALSSLGKS